MQKGLLRKCMIGVSLCSLLPLMSVLQAAELLDRPAPELLLRGVDGTDGLEDIGQIEVFVRLTEESVAAWRNNQVSTGQPEPTAEEQRAYAASLEAAQADVAGQLRSLGAEELSRLRVGDNGLKIRIDASQLANIRSIGGVSAVTKVMQYTPDLTSVNGSLKLTPFDLIPAV
jgi:hypothetical protein